jgi:uncharacterized membrane protein
VAEKTPVNVNRNERVLAYMLASAIGLSVLAIVAVIVATGAGVRDFGAGVWPAVIVLPTIGLPIGFILIIVLLVVSTVRKGRAARDADK